MADKFWVGGTGTWSTTNTTNWSLTSGGAGGAAVPGTADNAYFDSASGGGTVTRTATTAVMNLDFTGNGVGDFTGIFAGTAAISVKGNLKFSASMTRNYTGTITMTSVTTGKTITMAGKTLGGALNFNGTGGGWAFQDTISGTTSLVTGGAVDYNGQSVTFSGAVTFASNAIVRSITCGAGTITSLSFVGNTVGTGSATLNLNSATWTITGTGAVWQTGYTTVNWGTSVLSFTDFSKTASNFSPGASALTVIYQSRNFVTVGNITFTNLTCDPTNWTGFGTIYLAAITSIVTANLSGLNSFKYNRIYSSVSGNRRSLVMTNANCDFCAFKDMALTGTLTGFSTYTSRRDDGNNTGLGMSSRYLYWVGGDGNSWDAITTNWSLTSGGTMNQMSPGIFDTIYLDVNSSVDAYTPFTLYIVAEAAVFETINVVSTVVTGSAISTTSSTITISNTIVGYTGLDFIGANAIIFSRTSGTTTFNPNGSRFFVPLTFGVTGTATYTFASNLNNYGAPANDLVNCIITFTIGTLNFATYSIYCGSFASSNSNVRTLKNGAGLHIYNSGAAFTCTTSTNLTLTTLCPIILYCQDVATVTTFAGGGKIFPHVAIRKLSNTAIVRNLTITGSNTFTILAIDTISINITITTTTTQIIANLFRTMNDGADLSTLTSIVALLCSSATGYYKISKSAGNNVIDYVTFAGPVSFEGAGTFYLGPNSSFGTVVKTPQNVATIGGVPITSTALVSGITPYP